MTQQIVTGATRVSDALQGTPDAPRIFRGHGFDPRSRCGALCHHVHLRDVEAECGLEDTGALIDELRASLRTSQPACDPMKRRSGRDNTSR